MDQRRLYSIIIGLLCFLIAITIYGSYYAYCGYLSSSLAAAYENQAMKDRIHNNYPCR